MSGADLSADLQAPWGAAAHHLARCLAWVAIACPGAFCAVLWAWMAWGA